MLQKIGRVTGGTQRVPRYAKLTAAARWNNSFQNMHGMLQATIDRFARKIDFVQKKHLKNGYFCVHESELPDHGRTWAPNR